MMLSVIRSKAAQFVMHNLDQSLNVCFLVNNQFLKNQSSFYLQLHYCIYTFWFLFGQQSNRGRWGKMNKFCETVIVLKRAGC